MDVRHASGLLGIGLIQPLLQNFCRAQLLHFPLGEQRHVHNPRDGTFADSTSPTLSISWFLPTDTCLPPSSASTHAPRQISAVQSSSGNRLLFNHCPARSYSPRGPRRHLGGIQSHPIFPNAPFRSSRHRIPKNRSSAGSVHGRAGRLPHGVLGVWEAGLRELCRRLAKDLPTTQPPLCSNGRVCVHMYGDTVEPCERFFISPSFSTSASSMSRPHAGQPYGCCI